MSLPFKYKATGDGNGTVSTEDDTVAERRGSSRKNDRKDDESEVLHIDKLRGKKRFSKDFYKKKKKNEARINLLKELKRRTNCRSLGGYDEVLYTPSK